MIYMLLLCAGGSLNLIKFKIKIDDMKARGGDDYPFEGQGLAVAFVTGAIIYGGVFSVIYYIVLG